MGNNLFIESDILVHDSISIIKKSLDNVNQQYYNLITTYEPSGIVRERVFCYELYHNMRLLMDSNELSLNGEIDKRGHVNFDKIDQKNPDFVLHVPGNMKGNTIIVEVKGTIQKKNNIKKDFKTLYKFIEKYEYKCGLFILYNHSLEEFIQSMKQYLYECMPPDIVTHKIIVLCKKSSKDISVKAHYNYL